MFDRCVRAGSKRSCISPASEPASVTAQFQPLDPSIVSEAIPAFLIGRNKDGFWVARDAKGRVGELFLFKNSALSFAKNNSQPIRYAMIFPSHRFELDLKNMGMHLSRTSDRSNALRYVRSSEWPP